MAFTTDGQARILPEEIDEKEKMSRPPSLVFYPQRWRPVRREKNKKQELVVTINHNSLSDNYTFAINTVSINSAGFFFNGDHTG